MSLRLIDTVSSHQYLMTHIQMSLTNINIVKKHERHQYIYIYTHKTN